VFIIGHLRGRNTGKVFPLGGSFEKSPARNKIKYVGNLYPLRGKYDSTLDGDIYDPEGISPTIITGKHNHIAKIATFDKPQDKIIYDPNGISPTLVKAGEHGHIAKIATFDGNKQIGRIYENDGLSPTLRCVNGGGNEIKIVDSTVKGYKEAVIGDSINISFPNNPTKRGRVGKDRAQTLTTECQQATVTPSGRIRKLTPREYFRLQGFPDWAFEAVTSIRTVKETGISDTQLYNLAGNAVSVPVIYQIGTKLCWN